ncbi:MAG TPA: hypothetical protein VEK08_16560 [Planctomycetota bacterium]|nr:hypothetical protein [Planctomycetota bacterium]
MTSIEFAERYSAFHVAIQNCKEILGELERLSAYYEQNVGIMPNSASTKSRTNADACVHFINSARNQLMQGQKEWNGGNVFNNIEELKLVRQATEEFLRSFHYDPDKELVLFDFFRDSYQAYLKADGEDKPLYFGIIIINASKLWRFLMYLQNITQGINDVLIAPGYTDNETNHKDLTLYYDVPLTLGEITEVLHVIQELYSSICHVFGISDKEFPLRIKKLETGSLIVWLAGNNEAITTIGSMIEVGGAVYLGYNWLSAFLTGEMDVEKLQGIWRKENEDIASAIESLTKLKARIPEATKEEWTNRLIANTKRLTAHARPPRKRPVRKQLPAPEAKTLPPPKKD